MKNIMSAIIISFGVLEFVYLLLRENNEKENSMANRS